LLENRNKQDVRPGLFL